MKVEIDLDVENKGQQALMDVERALRETGAFEDPEVARVWRRIAGQIVENSFRWEGTGEGYDYWSGVRDRLEFGDYRPLFPKEKIV